MILSTSEFLATFFSALQIYFPEQVNPNSRTRDTPQAEVARIYDFIIVGGGSAGCVLANRLSENPNWTILLIEAGGDDDYISDTPFLTDFLLNTEKDWNYSTLQQKDACLSKNGICSIHRGKVIGGTSAIDNMFYARGNKEDYEEWERLGNKGWGFDDVLPYFIKAENMSEPCIVISSYHGTRGPLNVQYAKYRTPLRDRYTRAGEEVGWKLADYNGKNQSVIGYQQSTINEALRESASKAYLNPIRSRKNLHIILNSVVNKIIIKEREAKGVEYSRDGKTYKVFVKKDVILSAGTIETPKLLMLSGIGPRTELEKHNIDIVLNLPVGSNYINHENVEIFFKLHEDAPIITPKVWKTNESIMAFARKKDGPLTMSAHGAEATAFFNPLQTNDLPTVMATFFSYANIGEEGRNLSIVRVSLSNLKPNSVGKVRLKSNDFKELPHIQPNLLKNEQDRTTLERGIKQVIRLMEANVMLKYAPELYTKNIQDKCEGQHCVGTARMGPPEKEDTVVSSEDLLVKGMKGLRVIDGSIIPTIPRGSTSAVVIMVAEKGADIIKNAYKYNETEGSSDLESSGSTEYVNSDKSKQSNILVMLNQMVKPYRP